VSKLKTFFAWATVRAATLDLLSTYFAEIRKRWVDIFWGASLPFLALVLWWCLGQPPMWLTITVIAWGFLIAGYYAWREDHLRLIPTIRLTFENREPFVQTTPTQIRGHPLAPPGSGPDRVYIRVFPQCSTRVRDCTPYLLAIYREENGAWVPTPMNEPCLLTWANRPPVERLDIEPGIGPYVDVCYIEQGSDQINPCMLVRPARTLNAFHRLSTYRFDVKVTNGDPIHLCVRGMRAGQRWDRPEVEIVDPANSSN
jgi:hypothetical protein